MVQVFPEYKQKHVRAFLIVAFPLTLVLYAHGLQAPFYLDDSTVITTGNTLGLATRPLGYLSFYMSSVIAEVFGGLFPWQLSMYYRLGNLLVHVAAATAVFALVRELTGKSRAAFASGLLFLVHPVLSQPVMYITQRFESLATLLMVVSATTYVRFRRMGGRRWLVATCVCGLAAALTKETAMVLPAWILLIELTFFRGWRWDRRFVYLIPAGLVLMVPAWMAFERSAATLTSVSWPRYLASQSGVLIKYLGLSVFPFEQYLHYDAEVIEAFSWPLLAQWIAIVAILATGLALVRRYPYIGFGIVTFFVLLAPVTLLPLPDLIFEHRIYPAFVGLAVMFGSLFVRPLGKPVVASVLLLLFVYGARTYQRVGEWNDDVRFYEAHRTRFPADPYVLSALGVRYQARGQLLRGLETFEAARQNEHRFNPYYSKVGRINIALNIITASMAMQDFERAGSELEIAIALNPDMWPVRQMEGGYYLTIGEFEEAAAAFKRLTELEPARSVGWEGLGSAYTQLGRLDEANLAAEQIELLGSVAEEDQRTTLAIPLRYRMHVIFASLLAVLGLTVLAAKWSWIELRNRWSNG